MSLASRLRDIENAKRLNGPICMLCGRPAVMCPAPDDKRVHSSKGN